MSWWSVFLSESERDRDFLCLQASRLCFQPRINVAPLRSKLKQFFHRVPAILIFTWRGQAEDTLVMMKDIFPFSQLGHALTHHYPIDLIHVFPSTSLYLPRPSTPPPSLSLSHFCIHLPVDPSMLSHSSPDYTSHNGALAPHLLILSPHHFFHLPSLSFVPFLPPPDSHTFNALHPSPHWVPLLLCHPPSLSFFPCTFFLFSAAVPSVCANTSLHIPCGQFNGP